MADGRTSAMRRAKRTSIGRASPTSPPRKSSAAAAYRATPSAIDGSSNTTRLEWFPGAVAGSSDGGRAPRNAIIPGTCSVT